MGMFDSSQPQQSDTSFNYTTQQDKLKRQRLIADQLQKSQQPGNQTVNGAYGGLVVRNNPLTNIGPMLQSLIGSYLQNKTDSDQKDLDKQSLDQFSAQYAGLGSGVRDPKQDQVEADAQLLRESRRGPEVETVDAGQSIGAPTDGAQSFPVKPQTPANFAPLPPSPVQSVSPATKQVAANALISGGGGVFEGRGASGSWGDAQPAPMPAMPQPGPAMPPLGASPTAMPAMPPQASDQGMTAINGQVMPNPFTDAPSAPGMTALKDGSMARISNDDPYSKAPTSEQMVPRLIALGRTGPEGQRMADAQLNQMFASKNGRFTTAVHADPVNGGFVEVTTDTQTGQSQVKPIGAAGGATLVTGQRTGQDGTVYNVHKDGSTTPMTSPGGKPMMDGEAGRKNDEFGAKIAGERATAQGNLAALDKLSSDLSLAQGLAAKNAGKWAGGQATISQYFGGGSERQALERILNDTRLVGIMQDKENSGTAGAGLMKAYSEHGLNASMQPEALQQGITQMLGVINGQRAAKQAEIGVHDNLLQKYGPAGGQPQAAPASGARTPGNYHF